jgi:hypothetical protein
MVAIPETFVAFGSSAWNAMCVLGEAISVQRPEPRGHLSSGFPSAHFSRFNPGGVELEG